MGLFFGEKACCRPLEMYRGEAQELGYVLFFSFPPVFPPDTVILEAICYIIVLHSSECNALCNGRIRFCLCILLVLHN